jgi:hypothetical protein
MSDYQIKPSGYETLKQLVELYGMEVILDALNRIQPGCTDVSTLRTLLREVAPKCKMSGCNAIVTNYDPDGSEDSIYDCCDKHRFPNNIDYDLGIRIKAALED